MPALASSTVVVGPSGSAASEVEGVRSVTAAPARWRSSGNHSRSRQRRRQPRSRSVEVGVLAPDPDVGGVGVLAGEPAGPPLLAAPPGLGSCPMRAAEAQANDVLSGSWQRRAPAVVVEVDEVGEQGERLVDGGPEQPLGGLAAARGPADGQRGPVVVGMAGGQRQQPDPGLEQVLAVEPGVADRDQPVAVDRGDGAGEPAAAGQLDVDVVAPWARPAGG